jgi:hypothetical protein
VHDLVDVRRGHLLAQPLHRHLCIEVVAVSVADGEVPLPVARSHSDTYDEAVLARPAGAERRQVRVTCLKVNRDLLILR